MPSPSQASERRQGRQHWRRQLDRHAHPCPARPHLAGRSRSQLVTRS
jgi:hypothetical protein